MEELHSVFIYQEEREHEQNQKLINTMLELEAMKNMNTELHTQLKIAYQERDEARNQLQKLTNKFCPIDFPQENPFMFHSSNSESSTLSYSSSLSPSSVDSFFETASSSMFSNTGMGYLNHHTNPNFSYLMAPIEEQVRDVRGDHDCGSEYIDSIAKERDLPQKGKLLQAVVDAGPLLQTILFEGTLPTWRNPPHLQDNVTFSSSLLNFADNHLPHSSNNSLKYVFDFDYNNSFGQINSTRRGISI
ncbi:unnamed protein product [Lathyrus sativus]|nr:unnamed protein product [Lathyrus sativus]